MFALFCLYLLFVCLSDFKMVVGALKHGMKFKRVIIIILQNVDKVQTMQMSQTFSLLMPAKSPSKQLVFLHC